VKIKKCTNVTLNTNMESENKKCTYVTLNTNMGSENKKMSSHVGI
jgi:hypothetical protein